MLRAMAHCLKLGYCTGRLSNCQRIVVPFGWGRNCLAACFVKRQPQLPSGKISLEHQLTSVRCTSLLSTRWGSTDCLAKTAATPLHTSPVVHASWRASCAKIRQSRLLRLPIGKSGVSSWLCTASGSIRLKSSSILFGLILEGGPVPTASANPRLEKYLPSIFMPPILIR